jgi:preprotein translocase subunit SecG
MALFSSGLDAFIVHTSTRGTTNELTKTTIFITHSFVCIAVREAIGVSLYAFTFSSRGVRSCEPRADSYILRPSVMN